MFSMIWTSARSSSSTTMIPSQRAARTAGRAKARLQITDDGSGNAADRQSISFALNYVGKPVRGTVTKDTSGKLTFTPAT